MDLNILLFQDFETLDVFGPVEIFGLLKEEFNLKFYSANGGIIISNQGVKVLTEEWTYIDESGILMIPGGQGTRKLVEDVDYIHHLKDLAEKSKYCLTVCTGSGLLAKTGILKEKEATSNKIAFDWAKSMDTEVKWIKKARWVVDGKFYTSSGVSAGMDMALGFIADRLGKDRAVEIAVHIEYIWNSNKEYDIFAKDE
jgi:putative intracellular protease/amidase